MSLVVERQFADNLLYRWVSVDNSDKSICSVHLIARSHRRLFNSICFQRSHLILNLKRGIWVVLLLSTGVSAMENPLPWRAFLLSICVIFVNFSVFQFVTLHVCVCSSKYINIENKSHCITSAIDSGFRFVLPFDRDQITSETRQYCTRDIYWPYPWLPNICI